MANLTRLDLALEARKLLPSRARARDAILRGTVTVNGEVVQKPNQMVLPTDAIILIKPQFEVGRENVGGGGIVSDPAAIAPAIAAVIDFMTAQGFGHRLSLPSPIAGGDGNIETVAIFRKS